MDNDMIVLNRFDPVNIEGSNRGADKLPIHRQSLASITKSISGLGPGDSVNQIIAIHSHNNPVLFYECLECCLNNIVD